MCDGMFRLYTQAAVTKKEKVLNALAQPTLVISHLNYQISPTNTITHTCMHETTHPHICWHARVCAHTHALSLSLSLSLSHTHTHTHTHTKQGYGENSLPKLVHCIFDINQMGDTESALAGFP